MFCPVGVFGLPFLFLCPPGWLAPDSVSVWAVFKKALEAVGWQHRYFTSHSFSIGVALSAVIMGFGQGMVKAVGCWRSMVFVSYVRPLPERGDGGGGKIVPSIQLYDLYFVRFFSHKDLGHGS